VRVERILNEDGHRATEVFLKPGDKVTVYQADADGDIVVRFARTGRPHWHLAAHHVTAAAALTVLGNVIAEAERLEREGA